MAAPVLIIPGLGGSGPEHWQSLWQARLPDARRVEQADWDKPDRAGWIARLDAAVAQSKAAADPGRAQPLLRAGRLLGGGARAAGAGALLVAPADVEFRYPHAAGSARLPPAADEAPALPHHRRRQPRRSLCRVRRAIDMAKAWGAELVDIGEAGHINTSAGYGEWPEGERLLQRLQAGKPAYHSA